MARSQARGNDDDDVPDVEKERCDTERHFNDTGLSGLVSLSYLPRNPGLTILCCRSVPVHNCRSRNNCPGSQRCLLSSPCAPPPTSHRHPRCQSWHGLSMYHHPMDLRHSTSMAIGCIVNARFWMVGNRVAQTIPTCTEEDKGLSTMTIYMIVNNVLVWRHRRSVPNV